MTERLGRYRLVKLLGRGGVGEVYLGRLEGPGGFSRPVAIKRLKEVYRYEPAYRRQLIAEARVGALLDHPNVLNYFELAEEEREIYVVTEYLHGVSSRDLIRTSAERGEFLPVSLALFVIHELLTALSFAHDAVDDRGAPMRLVHRDVSPENVFLGHNGAVKLIDFGIAETTISPRDTAVFVVKGKAHYFSPEQALGEDLSGASDLYSAGLMLFELLTGTPALDGNDDREIMQRAASGQVASATEMRPELPEGVARILKRALSVDLGQRYGTAGAMRMDVRRAMDAVKPEHGPSELHRALSQYFGEKLETRRRAIWNHQSTAIVDTANIDSPRAASRPRPSVTSEPASAAMGVPIGRPMARPTPASPQPRYQPPSDVAQSPARPTVGKAGHVRTPPTEEPGTLGWVGEEARADPPTDPALDVDTLAEMEAAVGRDDDDEFEDRPTALNLDRLRRAVSQAYTDES